MKQRKGNAVGKWAKSAEPTIARLKLAKALNLECSFDSDASGALAELLTVMTTMLDAMTPDETFITYDMRKRRG